MLVFDKVEIRDNLTLDNIYNLLQEWGGEPEFTNFGILSSTICHNEPGIGSRKLYYYTNSNLFHCYSGCDNATFDLFELVIKVMNIQHHLIYDLNDAIRWVANKLGISGHYENIQEESLEDWEYLKNYERIKDLHTEQNEIILESYNDSILKNFNYNIKIQPWINENISSEIMLANQIGYYPGGAQITIPHFDKDNRFIGLRGRTLCATEGEIYGKYRPLKINRTQYNHPLGFNLYGLNKAKQNINIMKKAIVFEAEKSVLKYQSYFSLDSSIAVACCGSSLTNYQIQLLKESGAQEIIVAFDKQYEKLNTDESKKWEKKMIQLYNKYKNDILITFIWDKENLLGYKSSPIDEGVDKFLYLFKERIVL